MSAELDAGLAALQRGDYATAIVSLERTCQLDPNDYNAHMYLGAAYGQSQRNDDAVRVLTQAVYLQPANAQARYNLGVALERAGWPNQALEAMQQAVTLQPNYPKAQEAIQRLQQAQSPVAPVMAAAPAPAYAAGTPLNGSAPYGASSYGQAPYPAQPQANLNSPYGAPQQSYSPQQPYPTAVTQGAAPRPVPTGQPNIGAGVAVALLLGAACGLGFGYASVAMGMRIPFLTILIGYIIGYAVLKASNQPGPTQAIAAAISATGSTLLGLFIMYSAGVMVSPIAVGLVIYAGYRAYVIASG
ncbi:MAG TPA: tetratricopeptide repeat protein [Chthonomonadaceae bacterium]|nr:tetratricopeptide repeat protein [Chthonomonadaceae bacterium]